MQGIRSLRSKHDNHKSYTTNFTNGNIAVDFEGNRVKLPKLKNVKAKLHRKFSGQINRQRYHKFQVENIMYQF